MLNKEEAAHRLGLSTRSLERYTRQGKIAAHYQKGRTKPVPFYEEADLEALRAEMDLLPQAPCPARAEAAIPAETISFRLSPEHMKMLETAASKRGMGRNAYARALAVDGLESGEGLRLHEDIAQVRRLLLLIGEDMATMALALLLNAGRIGQEEEAREWVLTNFSMVREPGEEQR